MTDSEVAKICAAAGQNFDRVKEQLGLAQYPRHIVEQGDGIDVTFRYDLGSRWLFLKVRIETDKINRSWFADKRGAIVEPNPPTLGPKAGNP